MATVTNIKDALDGHVALEIECMDLLYLTRTFRTFSSVASGNLPHRHRGDPIAGVMEKNGSRFRREVRWVDQAVRTRHAVFPGAAVLGTAA